MGHEDWNHLSPRSLWFRITSKEGKLECKASTPRGQAVMQTIQATVNNSGYLQQKAADI